MPDSSQPDWQIVGSFLPESLRIWDSPMVQQGVEDKPKPDNAHPGRERRDSFWQGHIGQAGEVAPDSSEN